MPKPSPRFFALTAKLCIMLVALLVCAPQVPTATPATNNIIQPTASATKVFVPTVPKNAQEMVIFSYEEDGYAHLFAYIPNKLSFTRLTSGNWDDITPSPSPDGTKIAFASNRSGYWDLYTMNLATGEVKQLTDTPDYESSPTYSPDGSFLAFESYNGDNLDILVAPADDPLKNAEHLTTSSAADYSPAWAPDGRHIAFISDGDVVLANLDKTGGDRFKNLSNTDLAAESHPVWSPDGKKLAWTSSATAVGQSGIYVWDSTQNVPATWLGDGDYPVWNS